MGESRGIWGGFNSGILLIMAIMLLSKSQHFAAAAVKKNKSISNQCDDPNKECLLPNDVNMESLMDSEASKRVYETVNGLDDPASKSALCHSHNSAKSCVSKSDPRRNLPPNCSPSSYSKDCHRFLKTWQTSNQLNGHLNEIRVGEDLEPSVIIRVLQASDKLSTNALIGGLPAQKNCDGPYTNCIANGSKAKCLNVFGCRGQLPPKI